jgi:hypothetical protein
VRETYLYGCFQSARLGTSCHPSHYEAQRSKLSSLSRNSRRGWSDWEAGCRSCFWWSGLLIALKSTRQAALFCYANSQSTKTYETPKLCTWFIWTRNVALDVNRKYIYSCCTDTSEKVAWITYSLFNPALPKLQLKPISPNSTSIQLAKCASPYTVLIPLASRHPSHNLRISPTCRLPATSH